MSFAVSFTSVAEEDLAAALRYIEEVLKAPAAAGKLLDDVEAKTKALAENPFIFPIEKDADLMPASIRHMRIKNYLLFYVVDEAEQEVAIIRFLYARREWTRLLGEGE